MLKYWPVLFLVVPLVEVYLLIQVGSVIGAGWTILLVVLTAVIGVNLLRQQGVSTLMRANQVMSQGQIPAMEMMAILVVPPPMSTIMLPAGSKIGISAPTAAACSARMATCVLSSRPCAATRQFAPSAHSSLR